MWLPIILAAHDHQPFPKAPIPVSTRVVKASAPASLDNHDNKIKAPLAEETPAIKKDIFYPATNYDVTIHLVYDSLKYAPPLIQWLTPNSLSPRQTIWSAHGIETLTVRVEEGTHDFIAQFMPWYQGDDLPAYAFIDNYLPYSYIIVENVEVKEGAEFTIDLSQATNFIRFSALNNEGEPFKVPLLKIDEEAQTFEFDYTDANVWDVCYVTGFYNNKAGAYLMQTNGSYNHIREDGRSYADQADFYINTLSDNYTLYQNLMAYDSDVNTGWSINLATQADKSKTVTNTGKEYTAVEQEFLASPAHNPDLCQSPYGCRMYQYFNSEFATGYNFKFFGENTPMFYLGQASDFDCDFMTNTMLTPQSFDLSVFDEPTGEWIAYGIEGCPLTIEGGKTRYVNPYNNYFSSSAPHSGWIMGQGVPTTFAPFEAFAYSYEGRKVVMPDPQFIGQFGENCNIDLLNAGVEIYHDDELVCNSIFDLYEWAYAFSEDPHTDGTVKMMFFNDNILLGSDMRGSTTTEITYQEGNEDLCPPVLQMVRFTQTMMEKYGPILDTFLGQLKFSAGDINSNGWKTEYKEADIKVEYAVNGYSDFKELEWKLESPLQENQLPVYLIPLNRLDPEKKSPNGWFDFRFTVTDDAGNSMTQTFSPAVYIKKLQGESKISDIMEDGSEIIYYDVLGRQIASPYDGQIVIKCKDGKYTKQIFRQ